MRRFTIHGASLLTAAILLGGCTPFKAQDKQKVILPFNSFKTTDFIQSGSGNSLDESSGIFDFVKQDGEVVLQTNNTGTNIHAHLMNYRFEDMTFTGKLLHTDSDGGVGITFLSQYMDNDAYYRFRRYQKQKDLHIYNHSNSACHLESLMSTDHNTWYRFEVITEVLSTSTRFQVSVWKDGTDKATASVINCEDSSAERFKSGTIGVWAMGPGAKKWADFRIAISPFSGETRTDDPAPTPQPQPPPTPDPIGDELPGPTVGDHYTPVPPVAPANAIRISSSAELQSALANAKGGETFLLRDGNYDSLTLKNRKFTDYVTIMSESNSWGAKIGNISLYNVHHFRVQNLQITGSGGQVVYLEDGCSHIQILNNDISGKNKFDRNNPKADQISTNFGIRQRGGSHFVFDGNYLHDFTNGTANFGATNVIVARNKCDWIGSDCFKFGGVDQLLFEENTGAPNIVHMEGAHRDYMQAQGRVTNAVFRRNVAIARNGATFQGLFFGSDDNHNNILVENNLIHNGNARGISFNGNSSNLTVRKNTVIRNADSSRDDSYILGPISVNENNIVTRKASQAGPSGKNLNLQKTEPNGSYFVDSVYVNASEGNDITLEDFKPVRGGPGDCGSGMGAEELICELLGLN